MEEEKKIDVLKTITLHSGIGTLGMGFLAILGFPLEICLPAIGVIVSFGLASGIVWFKRRK